MTPPPETPTPAPPTLPPRRRGRWWRRLALALAGLITLIALFYAVEDFRGWRAWRHEVALLKQKGEPLTWAELVPPLPPEAENLAFAPPFKGLLDYHRRPASPNGPGEVESPWLENRRKADISLQPPGYGRFPRLADWSRGESVDLGAWARHFQSPVQPDQVQTRFPAAPKDAPPAAQVLAALRFYQPQMTAVRAACRRPRAQFPVHYEENFSALLPHLSVLRNYGRAFVLHGVAELRQHHPEAALADGAVLFKLRDALRNEPLLTSFLMRVSLHHLALQVVWEGMTEHRWSPDALEQIRAELATDHFLSDFVWAIRGERIGTLNTLERFCHGKLSWNILAPEEVPLLTPYHLAPSGWIRQNMARLSRYYRMLIASVGDTNRLRVDWAMPQTVSQQLHQERTSPYNVFVKLLAPLLDRVLFKAASAQAESHLALTACALEQRFLKTGRYPESLAELVPGEPPRWLRDPFDAQLLRYRRLAPDAFLLYSIGPNRRDDHGTPRREEQRDTEGDLIWRIPAR